MPRESDAESSGRLLGREVGWPLVYTRGSDVTPDGQRFLMIQSAGSPEAQTQIHVVLNWFEELKRRVPSGR